MILQQRSKLELNKLHRIFAELGFSEAPTIRGKHDLEVICRERRKSNYTGNSQTRQGSACGKAGYSSKAAALRTARARMERGACRLRVYLCPKCRDWHLTHSVGERLQSLCYSGDAQQDEEENYESRGTYMND